MKELKRELECLQYLYGQQPLTKNRITRAKNNFNVSYDLFYALGKGLIEKGGNGFVWSSDVPPNMETVRKLREVGFNKPKGLTDAMKRTVDTLHVQNVQMKDIANNLGVEYKHVWNYLSNTGQLKKAEEPKQRGLTDRQKETASELKKKGHTVSDISTMVDAHYNQVYSYLHSTGQLVTETSVLSAPKTKVECYTISIPKTPLRRLKAASWYILAGGVGAGVMMLVEVLK